MFLSSFYFALASKVCMLWEDGGSYLFLHSRIKGKTSGKSSAWKISSGSCNNKAATSELEAGLQGTSNL